MLEILVAATALLIAAYSIILEPLSLNPLSKIPGPKLYAITKWRLAWEDWQARRTRTIHALHQKHGPVVRTGPNEVHFNSLTALRTIYGPGSGFGRASFYRMFDVYGKQNLFSFHSAKDHGERKKLLANAYSKSSVIRGHVAEMVSEKIQDYIHLLETQENIFTSLHYYSLDSITHFLYGTHGATQALKGDPASRSLMTDILDGPGRMRLTWFAVHLPAFTKWLYSRVGAVERLVRLFLPMQKPLTYTGIRAHALKAMHMYTAAAAADKIDDTAKNTIIGRLYQSNAKLSDLEIASECADHFLAGIDTTSDTLMFLIWALSRPGNEGIQQKIIDEARSVPESDLDQYGAPTVEAADKLRYLDAVIKETLRLYAPLPASEPRCADIEMIIDGYTIPAWTTVCMSPYSLHRNEEVFPEPLKWSPDRWHGDTEHVSMMKKWWWAFSSGGRICIGSNLALAEMALVPAIYRRYRTKIKSGEEKASPGITSRVEVLWDETFAEMKVSILFRGCV
ncbi:uncharacterized protein MYCFIDRAFT_33596 [Pseudocercospora fijiensis CIRAD86]|uniref:Cytochrome P450 n=1 Tax=Pseudocercospora fijiensis (strain CIRAD86) TaxID=383855 RepID=M3AZH7_PSEFD|nr:uncharacterized protein MYCFIDRAFT_33596 [Pseudocercospora fijiensis CIRAD86]EME82578.1 hypothetical protein MYCFIDRAFT_33596 [Pseudocercospora fijiensis CIRAD86]